MSLLVVEDLSISFGAGPRVVDRVGFRLEAGQSLGVLGASGSGKSLTALAVMGLLPASASVGGGRILFEGRDLLAADKESRRELRGGAMGLVFQEPFTALNPLMRVGSQIEESLRLHLGLDASAAAQGAIEALERVGLNPGPERARQYPHQYSGGMRQRALLAMALAAKPRLLIADEPTTALDSTVQAQIVALLKRLQAELGFALLIISHDLAVIHALAGRAVVMEQGRVVEEADLARILAMPASAAARRLIAAYRGLSTGEQGLSSDAPQGS
ncbi:MAG TPA: ABC transporter ATP-binding protein [bacterium]|nr:ABC transporter ATP-binding protein [bacterium]